MAKAKKLTMTEQWMLDHPNDEPPPQDRLRAMEWRHKRFGDTHAARKKRADLAKYEAAMREKRER
jgi:hypothetical protein